MIALVEDSRHYKGTSFVKYVKMYSWFSAFRVMGLSFFVSCYIAISVMALQNSTFKIKIIYLLPEPCGDLFIYVSYLVILHYRTDLLCLAKLKLFFHKIVDLSKFF